MEAKQYRRSIVNIVMDAKPHRRLTVIEEPPSTALLEQEKEYPEIYGLEKEKFFIPANSWFKRRILFRLAWLGALAATAITLPFVMLKAAFKLLTLHPIQFLKVLFLGTLTCAGLALFSLASIFAPSIGFRLARRLLKQGIGSLDTMPTYNESRVFTADSDKGTVSARETLAPKEYDNYFLAFGGLGTCHEADGSQFFLKFNYELLKRRIILPNHPGLIPNYPKDSPPEAIQHNQGDYVAKSRTDFVNANAAIIYKLVHRHAWTNEEVAKHIQLSGHSLGGAIALQLAVHLRSKFGIDVPVHIDRSFRSLLSVAAGYLTYWPGIPWHCSRMLAACALYGGGDLNFNSVAACRKLKPDMIHYYNLGHDEERYKAQPSPISRFRKMLAYFGCNRLIRFLEKNHLMHAFPTHADNVLPDGTTLTDGLEEAKETWYGGKKNGSTKNIFTSLNVERKDHLVFYNGPLSKHDASEIYLLTANLRNFADVKHHDVSSHNQPQSPKMSVLR